MIFSAAFSGFLLGASLIIAIGAQNAFVLRQGLMRQHVFIICLICALSDALLITAGVAGLGAIISQSPRWIAIVTIGGAAFLFWYAYGAFNRALCPEVMQVQKQSGNSLQSAIITALALTFLNPHVYLDTVLLLGSLSASFEGRSRIAYGAGAAIASFIWFFGLGYCARFLQPIFAKPKAWQILDIIIGVMMSLIAFSLLSHLFS